MSVTKEQLQEAIDLLGHLADFAYEQGFHECGYNPLKVVNQALEESKVLILRYTEALNDISGGIPDSIAAKGISDGEWAADIALGALEQKP